MTIIRAQAIIRQSMDGDDQSVTALISAGSEGEGPARGQLGWAKLGQLTMAAQDWRALRAVLTVPDYNDEDGPDVAVEIHEVPDVTGSAAQARNEIEVDNLGQNFEGVQPCPRCHGTLGRMFAESMAQSQRVIEQRDALLRLIDNMKLAAGIEDAGDPIEALMRLRERAEEHAGT